MHDTAGVATDGESGAIGTDLPDHDLESLRRVIARLLTRTDTATQRSEATAVAEVYQSLSDTGRRRFLTMVGREFGTDTELVDAATERLRLAVSGADRRAAERDLRRALSPSAAGLLHLFTGMPHGVKLLVDLRADLLHLGVDDPVRADLDQELKAHLATLFDVGLLELRRITWDTSASLLEKLIDYEAVHAIDSWADLKNRLDSDRRCYAFFHPAMPAEPIVFVEIALTAGMVEELPQLLDEEAPELDLEHADTAIFYSINSCQPGLAGVNLGNALIKQVAEQLAVDLPGIGVYATLSPIPGFRDWIDTQLRDDALLPSERSLSTIGSAALAARLATDDWPADDVLAQQVKPLLLALAARYLTTQRGTRVIDPVANFHLANGASLERLCWFADTSSTGLRRSAGIMASYRYEPERLSARAQAYAATGELTLAPAVSTLLTDPEQRRR